MGFVDVSEIVETVLFSEVVSLTEVQLPAMKIVCCPLFLFIHEICRSLLL